MPVDKPHTLDNHAVACIGNLPSPRESVEKRLGNTHKNGVDGARLSHDAAENVKQRLAHDVTYLQTEVTNLERILKEQKAGAAVAEKRLAVDYLEHGKPLPVHVKDYLLTIRRINDHRLAQLDENRHKLSAAKRALHQNSSV